MMKKIAMMLALMPAMAMGQVMDFDMTKPLPVYSDANGAGYDIVAAPTSRSRQSRSIFPFACPMEIIRYA